MFVAVFEVSFVGVAFSGGLATEPGRFIVLPVADIDLSVCFYEFSLSMSFGVDPLTFVKMTGRVGKLASAVGLVIFPFSSVTSFIGPGLSACSISLIHFDFSVVGDPRWKFQDKNISLAGNDVGFW